MVKGSDESWTLKMYNTLTERDHFSKPRMGGTSFLVRHYADVVEYTTEGFCEKNKVWIKHCAESNLLQGYNLRGAFDNVEIKLS